MKLFDTRSAKKHIFKPRSGPVRMYVCGVTPYAETHMGHAMSYVVFDVLRRYLEYCGFEIFHVQNFTDIDDKIVAKALEAGLSFEAIANKYIQEYQASMDKLNVLRAHVYPRVTQEIPRVIEMIQVLFRKQFAYLAGGDVYFRVKSSRDYGKLSHRTLDGMMAGARVEVDARKEHPMDFALWKAARPGEPAWDSPWGKGRPGWHIECSAMILRYLGSTVDIHGGGRDLIFPHHENEIAQSEGSTGETPFVRFWVHNGLLNMDEAKMSKSLLNFVSLKETLEHFSADGLRLFFLGSQYRNPLSYSQDSLETAEQSVGRLRNALREPPIAKREVALDPEPYATRFREAMDDDLNTPQALAAIFDLTREINRARDRNDDIGPAQGKLRELAGVLGLTMEQPQQDDVVAQPFIDLLVEIRTELRTRNSFDLADLIRIRLAELGIVLEDTGEGTYWKQQNPSPL